MSEVRVLRDHGEPCGHRLEHVTSDGVAQMGPRYWNRGGWWACGACPGGAEVRLVEFHPMSLSDRIVAQRVWMEVGDE